MPAAAQPLDEVPLDREAGRIDVRNGEDRLRPRPARGRQVVREILHRDRARLALQADERCADLRREFLDEREQPVLLGGEDDMGQPIADPAIVHVHVHEAEILVPEEPFDLDHLLEGVVIEVDVAGLQDVRVIGEKPLDPIPERPDVAVARGLDPLLDPPEHLIQDVLDDALPVDLVHGEAAEIAEHPLARETPDVPSPLEHLDRRRVDGIEPV